MIVNALRSPARHRLKLHRGDAATPSPGPVAGTPSPPWLINGYPFVVVVWTRDEWDRLKVKPPDAQRAGSTWCALRDAEAG